MSALDALVIFLAVAVIAFFTWQRMVRALFFLVVIWAATLLAGLAYKEAAFRTKVITGSNPILAEGLFFIGLFVLVLVVGYIVVHLAFPVTYMPSLGILDYLMGFLLGVVIAVLVGSVIINGWGLIVSQVWKDRYAWSQWNVVFTSSILRPWTRQVFAAFRILFIPFFNEMPPALYPF